jgi:hypothetical protein
MMFSRLNIINNSVIFNNKRLLNAFVSNVTISNVIFRDLKTLTSIISLTGATLNFKSIALQNISEDGKNKGVIKAELGSFLTIENITCASLNSNFLNMFSSTAHINNLSTTNTKLSGQFVYAKSAENLTMTNINFKNMSVSDYIVVIDSSYVHIVENMTAVDSTKSFFKTTKSTVNLMKKIYTNNFKAEQIRFYFSQLNLMTDSKFENGGTTGTTSY